MTHFSSIVDLMAKSLSSLRVSHGPRSVKMKLTNKKVPCLTFEIQLVSGLWYEGHVYTHIWKSVLCFYVSSNASELCMVIILFDSHRSRSVR